MASGDLKTHLKRLSSDFSPDHWTVLEFRSAGQWPVTLRIIILFGIFLIVLIAGYLLLIRDTYLRLEQLNSQKILLTTKLESRSFLAANLDAYRQMTKEAEQRLKILSKQIPDQAGIPEFIEQLQLISDQHQIQLLRVTPSPAIHQHSYQVHPIQLELSGNYHQLGHLTASLIRMERLVTLHNYSIHLNPDAETDSLKILLMIRIYYQPSSD
ncbi:type 4a pilus biogenesis protein PilO [Oceanospirillum sediminis]|uniref:Type 4a pilus biogenesis protein PilO n=1 Tax=Oceanospirillum sediminis TaxID=2760088 RepID=A0A839IUY8_9GAMM|nr:type 4a pilus biogenesis protein PilO [Oceanospirillum sediminis]MBB1487936.1 type 4a pilus biogenesis protein PilO [Oceanospirillum sediminis]